MMLDKKQIRAHFLFEFKMGCKAAETTHNTHCWLTQRCKVQKFGEGEESLENEECSGWPTDWEQSSKLILLQLREKLPKHSAPNILQSFSIWSKLERWKSSVSGCLVNWPQIQKKLSLWSVIFSYCMQQQRERCHET